MTRSDPRRGSACIVGVAQRTVRPDEGASGLEPLDLWEDVVRRAATDAGATSDLLSAVDSVQIVYCQSWQYDDPTERLCERLGVHARHRHYSGIGGTTPQVLVSEAAAAIDRGDYDVAIITGAEALDTRRRLKKAGEKPSWSHPHQSPPPFPFEAPFHPTEVAHEVFQAWLTFALFDIARRASTGAGPEEHRRRLGELLAPMTEVAAGNQFAWFPRRRSAEELITPTADNRMVGYPYTKFMISVMDVDMAAAVVICSDSKADDLGIPRDRRVYLRGSAYFEDPVYVAEHAPLRASPAMEAAGDGALRQAGAGIDDVAHLDLYSCFASSIDFARDALGIADDDRRALTVTGGLPFAGGAGSNYMTHSIATMVDVLRADPGTLGLVTGVGMHMTKHIHAVYSTTPGELRPVPPPVLPSPKTIVSAHTGEARVATYSVIHDRSGEAVSGVAVLDVGPKQANVRAYAKILDHATLAAMEREEWVGRDVHVVAGENDVNIIKA